MSIYSRALPLLAVALLAGCASVPKYQAINPDARQITGARDVRVTIPQGEIGTTYNPSNVAAASAGVLGPLGALVVGLADAGINEAKARKADKSAEKLRNGLVEFDFDARAVEATRNALIGVDWFALGEVSFAKRGDEQTYLALADAAKSPQIVFVNYTYRTTPDFGAVEVIAKLHIAPRAAPEQQSPKSRLMAKNAIYAQGFNVLVPLKAPSKDPEENLERWGANNSKLAREALERALQQVPVLFDKGLSISPETSQGIIKQPLDSSGLRPGKLVEKTEQGVIVWENLTKDWTITLPPVG